MPILRTIQFLVLIFGMTIGGLAQADMSMQMSGANNPCSMKGQNPCNPCGMKSHNPCNPCSMKNPCASVKDAVDPNKITRPAGTKLYSKTSTKKLVKLGKKLFRDTSLSSIGISCKSCHATDHLFNKSFSTPYPHRVKMAKDRAGMDSINADEFVQFCLLTPMAGETLPWESKKLAALTAYMTEVKQKKFIKKVQANPCYFKQRATDNPCSGMNPCNPCNMKPHNPCGMKNPCSM